MIERRLRAIVHALVCAAPLAAQDPPAVDLSALRSAARAAVAAGETPSLAVGVMLDGRVLLAEGFGVADLGRGTPATVDTIYRLASISKPITATALMKLVERGALALDDPVDRHLEPPGITAWAGTDAEVTLRRLANHTAGLPTHWSFFYRGSEPPPREVTIARYGFTVWPPGTRTNYSNLAFGILDHIVARAAGRTYRDFLVAEVLDPAGMASTDAGVRPGATERAAVAYEVDAAGRFVPVIDYGFDHDGASAIRSSVDDLLRFARLFCGGGAVDGIRVLDAATVAAMTEPRAVDAGSRYGVGWAVGSARGERCLSHTGGMPGVSTSLRVFPQRGAAVVVLANGRARGAVRRVEALALDALFGPLPDAGDSATAPADREAETVAPPLPSLALRGALLHHDGWIPLRLARAAGGPVQLWLGDRPLDGVVVREARADRMRLETRARLATTAAFHGTPVLHFELERDGARWAGVCYADGDATLRLPHRIVLEPEDPKPDGALRVATWNVLVGFADHRVDEPYLPGHARRERIWSRLAALAPDVVALQELNGYTEARLGREAAALGHRHAALLKEDGFPVGLTSRWPIEVVERRTARLHHGYLHARTAGVDVVVVHVVPFPGVDAKRAELAPVTAIYRAAIAAGRPCLLLGDFNAISAHDVAHYSDAALDRYRRWRYALDGDRPAEFALDVVEAAGAVDVLLPHAEGRWMPLPRIDFVFASPDLAARRLAARWRADPESLQLSDHPLVIADFAPAPL